MNASRLAGASVVGMSLLLSACSFAPATTQPSTAPSGAMEQVSPTPAMTTIPTPVTMKPDQISGATIIAGKVVLIGKSGQFEILTEQEATVGSAKVMMDGKVVGKDGSSAKLTEGMTVDMQGAIKTANTQTIIDAKRKLMIPQNASAVPEPEPGAYQDYAPTKLAASKANVLFFKASWCPTCKAADADIMKNLDKLPGDVNLLKVDYDNSAELKAKYGVTYQHTFVLVDAKGNKIRSWNGSTTLEDIVNNALAG